MKKIFGLVFFAALMLIAVAAHAETVEYEIKAGESVMLVNINDGDSFLNVSDDFEAVSYYPDGRVWLQSNLSPVTWVKSGGYAIITAVNDSTLEYNDNQYSIKETLHPALQYITIEPDQCIELTDICEGNCVIISEPELSESGGSFLYSYEWPNFITLSSISRSVVNKSVYIVAQNARQVISVPYGSFEIKDMGNPFFTEYDVDSNGVYFTCIKDGGTVDMMDSRSSFRFQLYDTETGQVLPSAGRVFGSFNNSETIYLASGSSVPITYRYMTDYFTLSETAPFASATPEPTPTPTPIPAAPDKNMDDMTVREIIEAYPVRNDYSAATEYVLFSNMREIGTLYNACAAIAQKVSNMSGGEYAEVSEMVDAYLHGVDKAYATLNVEDFPSAMKSGQFDELTARREAVNAKIALEPPKIVSVENIYPSANFNVEVHSMYTTNSNRDYALSFSNLSAGREISVTKSSIGKNSYSDRVTLYSGNCEADNRIEIDIIYNGVNCRDTKGCSFTGTVMEDKSSEWAENEIDAAIALGLVPKELQGNYRSRISRRGFCLLAAAAVEVKTGESIAGYASKYGQASAAFSDTSESEIMSSSRLGIVYGYDDGTFRPFADITREQAAAMLERCAKLLGLGYGPVGGTFRDNELISGWAADSVAFVRSNEIMAGDENNNFMPQGGYTIEQAIATFYRMYNKLL